MKMPPQQQQPENCPSKLLNNEENLQVFKLIANRCQTISTSVVQLYLAEPPTYSQWIKRDVGVLCLVKDNTRKNYFFRLFCLKRNFMVWEHEMYNHMEYTASTPFLHIFEGEDAIVGFNFADTDEARDFKSIVDQKISMKKKREEKRLKSHAKDPISQKLSCGAQEVFDYKKTTDPAAKQAKRKRNITKADISSPLDFKHITHVGWHPDSGFDIDSQDEKMTEFFEKAGVSKKQLQDPETREFIYDFIQKHGGCDALDTNSDNHMMSSLIQPSLPTAPVPPMVPPRGAPRAPHVRSAPPPPPSHSYNKQPPPSYAGPPKSTNSLSPPMDLDEPPTSPPPPPPPPMMAPSVDTFSAVAGAPPPPPPPPMFVNNLVAPPPPPMMVASTNIAPSPAPVMGGATLADIIKGGSALRPVDERKLTPVDDSRNDLLEEIRRGTKLKPVNDREVRQVNNVVKKDEDLADALKRALAEKFEKAKDQSEDDDSEEEDDEEWE